MKILFISQRVPYPPNKGDKLRSYNEIKYLSQRHQVSLACLADGKVEAEGARHLEPVCHSIDVVYLPKYLSKAQALLSLCSGTPLSLGYFRSGKLKALVERKLQEEAFDLVFVYCSSMAQYVMDAASLPRVIDFVDVDSEKWRQYARHAPFPMNLLYRLESRRLRAYERLVARSFRHAFLVSEKEAADFRAMVEPAAALTAVPNGVDTSLFAPPADPEEYDDNALCFIGQMDYFPNVEAVLYFAREILPLIRRRAPETTFYVVGSSPAPEVAALGKSDPKIVVTGFVQAVQPYVVRCAAMVAPMRIARGVQNKILEGMSMGVPVVTSSLGFEGISATPGEDILVADAPEDFAAQVLKLMESREARRALSRRGRTTVLRQYEWGGNLETLERILLACASEAPAHPLPEGAAATG